MDLEQIVGEMKKQNPGMKMSDLITFIQSLGGGGYQREVSEEDRKAAFDGEKPTVENIVKRIKEKKMKNIIVLCGAGISVNAGIPDFRSPGSGLYDNLEEYGLEQPEQIFDIRFFRKNPAPFYKLSKDLLPKKENPFQPTLTHRFFKALHDEGLLVRIYTQNIDSLEFYAGIPEEKVIEAHGHFRSCHCIECKSEFSSEVFKEMIMKEETPIVCPKCGKGLIKPDIVFFGEALPERFSKSISEDFEKCDLVIIAGTSLVVSPFCTLVDECTDRTPRLLFNMEKAGPFTSYENEGDKIIDEENYRDVMMLGDCDKRIQEFADLLGIEIPEKKKE